MILFTGNNSGFLFLSRLITVLKKIVYKSTITILISIKIPIVLLLNKIRNITLEFLISSGIYVPVYIETTNFWAQSIIQSTILINSTITLNLRYSTKLRDYHG